MTSPLRLPGDDRLDHAYGPRVHILNDRWSRTTLAALCHPQTKAPRLHRLLEDGYRQLLVAASEQLPHAPVRQPTRMTAQHPGVWLEDDVVDPHAKVVVVDIARGGMVPSYVVQQSLLEVVDPDGVRIDHLYLQRVTDDAGHVIGVRNSGSKIGGGIEDATLLIPDPMGATGSSIRNVLRTYAELAQGTARKIVTMHLIVTPEYLRNVLAASPNVEVYALRLDRGLSPAEVLAERPGVRWDEERGLDAHHYIVPGAGGLGELINNAFV